MPERELAQGKQVPSAKEVFFRTRRLIGNIDFSFAEALEELIGRKINEFDLVGSLENSVRDGLANANACHLAHDVVQALDVLDVERRVDVDSRIEQVHHVLPALLMAPAWRIRVRELIKQKDLGVPL